MIQATALLVATFYSLQTFGGLSGRNAANLRIGREVVLFKDQRQSHAEKALRVKHKRLLSPPPWQDMQLWEYQVADLPNGYIHVRYRADAFGVNRVLNWRAHRGQADSLTIDVVHKILANSSTAADAVSKLGLEQITPVRAITRGSGERRSSADLANAGRNTGVKHSYRSTRCAYLRIDLYLYNSERIGAYSCRYLDEEN